MTNETMSEKPATDAPVAADAAARRSPPAFRRRVATIAAVMLAVGALPYLALNFAYAGPGNWDHVLDQFINDPGKALFHFLLLPSALWLFLSTFPRSTITAVRQHGRHRAMTWLIAGTGLIAVFWVTWDDANTKLQAGLGWSVQMSVDNPTELMEIERGLRKRMPLPDSEAPDSLRIHYAAEFERIVGPPQELHFLTDLNAAGLYSVFMSLVGASLTFLMVLAYLVAHFTKTMDMRTNESFLMVIGLLVPWLLLRAYSEWYANFGDVNMFLDYTPFIPALMLSVLAIFFCYLSRQRSRRPIVIAVGIMAAIPGALSIFGAFSPEFAGMTAEIFYATPLSTKFTIYAAIILVVLGTGFSLVPQRRAAANGR